ncbi:hypothetical protein MKX01_035414 [Papaver californicum]|nr:hypothetical protein MKX01_035414 [Papaver californicum]
MEPKHMMETITADEPVNLGLGLLKKGNVTPVAKSSKKSVASFFEATPDGESQSCKFCNQSYSIATALDNLRKHLTRCHPGYKNDNTDGVFFNPPPEPITTALKSSTVDLDL